MSALDDDAAIRRLVSTYCDGVCRHDVAAWSSVWADDGARWDLAGHVLEGKAIIVAFWQQAMSTYDFVFQTANTGVVDLDGDTATGRWFVTEHARRGDGGLTELWGIYHDRYVRTPEGWRVSERVLQIVDARR